MHALTNISIRDKIFVIKVLSTNERGEQDERISES